MLNISLKCKVPDAKAYKVLNLLVSLGLRGGREEAANKGKRKEDAKEKKLIFQVFFCSKTPHLPSHLRRQEEYNFYDVQKYRPF